MSYQHDQQFILVSRIFRGQVHSRDDGVVVAKNCPIFVDRFKVLSVFEAEDASNGDGNIQMYFPLLNAESIQFRRIRSAGGRHTMGRLVIIGRFGLVREKITMKMEMAEYDKLLETINLESE